MIVAVSFFVLLLAWLILPFLPGLIEIRKKSDASPLNVVQEYDVDIHYFANVFRGYVNDHFSDLLNNASDVTKAVHGQLDDDTEYFVLNHTDEIPLQESEKQSQVTDSMLVSSDSLTLPGAMSYLTELYARDSIHGGEEDIYRALLAENNIFVAENSLLLRWMHAGNSINIKPRSTLHGRVSADNKVQLSKDCHFERLYAPVLLFGENIPLQSEPTSLKELSPESLGLDIENKGGRWLVEHDLEIPDNSLINSSLVVVGRLNIGKNCLINGSVKSREVLFVGQGTHITGSLVSNMNIHCDENASIAGPVISEEKICLGNHTTIGSQEKPTTISAEEIEIKLDSVAYGTVWARQKGIVII